jgi:hypothetical protein
MNCAENRKWPTSARWQGGLVNRVGGYVRRAVVPALRWPTVTREGGVIRGRRQGRYRVGSLLVGALNWMGNAVEGS